MHQQSDLKRVEDCLPLTSTQFPDPACLSDLCISAFLLEEICMKNLLTGAMNHAQTPA